MYPFTRLAKTVLDARKAAPLGLLDTHVMALRCWPHDLDIFMEMNNGRVLTLLDLGRTGLAIRAGLMDAIKREKWGLAVAGGTTRYRKRIRLFDRLEMRTRCVGWDARFIYMEQSLWQGETCAAHALLRTCITDRNGIVATDRGLAALGVETLSPPLPDWVKNWIDADASRPWPPERAG